MKDKDKTKEQLVNELLQTRQRVAELESLAEECEQAREELRGERDRAQKYFDVAYGIMVVIDSHGKARLINQKGCEILGYKKKEILGKDWYDNFVPETIRDEVKAVSARLMAGKIKPVEYFENPVLTNNGEERLIAWHNAVLKDEEGNIVATLSSGEDITERRKVEEELRKSNERYQLLMDRSLESMWFTQYEEPIDIILPEMEIARLVNERGVITQANNALAKIYGFNRGSQLAGKRWAEFLPFEENKEFYLKFVRSNYNVRGNMSIERDRKGNVHYSEDSLVGNIVDGKLVGSFGTGRDMTERRKAEEELRESNERYQLLMDRSLESIWFTEYEEPIDITLPEMEIVRLMKERGVITQVNNTMAEAYGFHEAAQLIGKRWVEFLPFEENKEFYLKFVRSNYNIRENMSIERDRKGNVHYAENSIIGNIVNGKMVNSFGTGRDMTERREAEEELRKSHERYELLMDRSLESMWFTEYEEPIDITLPEMEIARLINERGVIAQANNTLAKAYGFNRRSQLAGKHWAEFMPFEENKEFYLKFVRSNYNIREQVSMERDRKGNILYSEDSSVGNIVDGKLVNTFGTGRDITERKKAQEERKELERKAQLASRLATVGEMSSGIAHEINNPLTGVIGFAQLLMQKKDITEDIREYTKIIHDGAQRVAGIVDRLLTFARQHKPERSYANINDIIQTTLKLRTYAMETSNIKLTTQLDPDLPGTMADAAQLQQVFLNIIINAEAEMKSAHGKGELQVKTEGTDNTIRISFKDDGPGIASENLEKVFDPFFTTREVGRGTGLGLSLCYGIIAEHHGRLYARSKLGQGATFVVELPVIAEEKQLELAEPAAYEARKVTGARILVVDDEPAILRFLSQILTDEGHRVETVESADAALEKIKSERYSLILLDIKLPGMSGMELYKKIKRTAQTLARRVVFITGDVLATDTRKFLSRAKAPYISKPFDAEKLTKEINRILAEGI